MNNDRALLPRCVEDLQIYREKFLGKEKFFMVSEEREKYLKLTEAQFRFFNVLIEYLDGNHSFGELNEKIGVLTGGEMNAGAAVNTMYKNNLLEEQYEETYSKVELELSSRKLFELQMSAFQNRHHKLLLILDRMINLAGAAALVYALYLLLFNMPLVHLVVEETGRFSWKQVSIRDFLFIAFLSAASVPIHELGHLMAANRCMVRWKSFTLALKWGVNPVYYIKYYNFYTNSSKSKVIILLSGVYYNLLQAGIYFILLVHLEDWRMAVLCIINLGCIVSCMMPSGTSDGYHVMALLMGAEGLRWKMILLISEMVKDPGKIGDKLRKGENLGLLLYFVSSYGLGIYSCYVLLLALLDYLHIFAADKLIVSWLLGGWILISVIVNLIKFGRKLRTL